MFKKVIILGISFIMLTIGAIPANAAGLHNIQYGDSLFKIAVNNGITVDQLKRANDLKGNQIYAGGKLNVPTTDTKPSQRVNGRDIDLLARLVTAEASGEPFKGKVAVASVIFNRMDDPKFPATVAGNIFKPHEFESVSNGLIWERQPTDDAYKAADVACKGWDPTYGSKYFFNPAKIKGPSWVWTRKIVDRIGNHVFGV